MSDTPLAGLVAVVSGGGRGLGLGRSFCLALAWQGARVVVSNRNRVTDADGRGPADQVAAEILAAWARRWPSIPTRPIRPAGRRSGPPGCSTSSPPNGSARCSRSTCTAASGAG